MPLQRDQLDGANDVKSASSFIQDRHHGRSKAFVNGQVPRPSTPQHEPEKSLRSKSIDMHTRETSHKHQISDEQSTGNSNAVNVFKIAPPNTMQPTHNVKPQRSVPRHPNFHQSNQEWQPDTRKTGGRPRLEPPEHSTFDDTESLGQSYMDSLIDDNQTAILVSTQAVHNLGAHDRQTNSVSVNQDYLDHGIDNATQEIIGPNWQEEVENERKYLKQKQQAHLVASAGGYLSDDEPGEDYGSETPSRTQSAPPFKGKVQAPIPRKNVNFAIPDKNVNLSPNFQSLEMLREDNSDLPLPLSTGAVPRSLNMPVHKKPRDGREQPRSEPRSSHVALQPHSDRFHKILDHRQSLSQESHKVSAPESDNQDFSEDEGATSEHLPGEQPDLTHNAQEHLLTARKRSHGDSNNDLDYDATELKEKKLSELQAESFSTDPRVARKPPPTDGVGNDMSLAQILENLVRVPEDAQRETFKGLTDEQWAQTGQWFVNKFQTDLKELTKIRLERRKIALAYEDKIRRRQRLVEHHEAEVNKELEELQTGGKQLVDGRKLPGGSRSGTPLKRQR